MCSSTSFLLTLSKYARHMCRKRSRMSFSTSSCASSPSASALSAFLVVSADRLPGSAETCFVAAGGCRPKNGRA